MFQGAGGAMRFYASLFTDGAIDAIRRYGPDTPERERTVKQPRVTIAGQHIRCIDRPAVHRFDFTPPFSLFVDCS